MRRGGTHVLFFEFPIERDPASQANHRLLGRTNHRDSRHQPAADRAVPLRRHPHFPDVTFRKNRVAASLPHSHNPSRHSMEDYEMHKYIEPAILYFGTPVVLMSTQNEDGTTNIAPMSSVWWLGWSCMIGLDASSQTTANLQRTGECVLNMPSADLVESVNRIAKTTGRKNLPLHKKSLGYRYEPDKIGVAGLTAQESLTVTPPRLSECPVQLEARVRRVIPFGEGNPRMAVPAAAFDLDIKKVHVEDSILIDPEKSYIDPDKWHPLIMSFRKFYSTGGYIHPSTLAEGPENQYAPWKRKGVTSKLIEWAVARNTKSYREAVASQSHE